MEKQYLYECQEKSGGIFSIVLNKKFPVQTVIDYLNQNQDQKEKVVKCKFVKELEKGQWHWCQYCGELVEGNDKDILCYDCMATFGHTRFSEL